MFEDPIFSHYRTSRLSRMMLLSVAQWPSWNVMCGDVWHNAFLPKEVTTGLILRLLAAPRCSEQDLDRLHEGEEECIYFGQEADRRLRSGGWEKHPIDQCCYLLSEADNQGRGRKRLVTMIIRLPESEKDNRRVKHGRRRSSTESGTS